MSSSLPTRPDFRPTSIFNYELHFNVVILLMTMISGWILQPLQQVALRQSDGLARLRWLRQEVPRVQHSLQSQVSSVLSHYLTISDCNNKLECNFLAVAQSLSLLFKRQAIITLHWGFCIRTSTVTWTPLHDSPYVLTHYRYILSTDSESTSVSVVRIAGPRCIRKWLKNIFFKVL